MARPEIDYKGRTFGVYKVLRSADLPEDSKKGQKYWICKCMLCGKETIKYSSQLRQESKRCVCNETKKGKDKILYNKNKRDLEYYLYVRKEYDFEE